MIKAITFDLGGVVVGSFGKELVSNASKKLKIPSGELRRLMNQYEPALQRGTFGPIEFWKKILKDKGLTVPESVIKPLWMTPYRKLAKSDRKVISLIHKLKKRYTVGCISNCQEPHNSYNRKRGLFKHFKPCLLSSEIGMRKPDVKIFQLFLKQAKCKPSEAVFIDDEKRYLTHAKKMGIHIIHFKSYEQLKKELVSLGILTK